jgi:hypothetical protein
MCPERAVMCPELVEGHRSRARLCALSELLCALSSSKGTLLMCPEPVEGHASTSSARITGRTLRQAQRAFIALRCPQISLSTLQPACQISMITRCRGSIFFAAPMTPSTSAVRAILNLDYSSTPSVGLTRTQGFVDRWRWPGLKNVSMSRTRTCSNARSKDGGAKRSSR